MRLDKTQSWALRELGRKLKENASRVTTDAHSFDPKSPVQTQYANTFGLLGPRGAGKSTLLSTVYEAWSLPLPKARDNGEAEFVKLQRSLRDLFVLRPLDCSIMSAEVAPGAAILLHLERELPSLDAEMRSELHRLSEQYGETTEQFRILAAELAATIGEYNRQIIKSTRNRLDLGKALSIWLEKALKQLEKEALVVLLDDFDLVHAREVRRWLFSLLDELHQERLLVVLTADFYRLEHLSFDPKAEVDDLTGRALLDKLLPSQNRVNLERWDIGARSSFGFTDDSEGPKVKDRIKEYSFGSKSQLRLLTRLLPGWPRGLQNLLSSLGGELSVTPNSKPKAVADRPERRTWRFLGQLASCRGEHLLARELLECDLVSWIAALRFKNQSESVEAWEECVAEASQRWSDPDWQNTAGEVGRDLSPLPLLRPDVPKKGSWKLGAYTLQADMSGRDLLRHEELRGRPLKDADERLTPVWVETLLNYALAESSPLSQGRAVHNRIRFVTHWPPVVSRFDHARFRVKLGRATQRSFFEDNKVPASALLWLRWNAGIDSEMSIGWQPLLSALRGARSVWQVEAMRDILVNLSKLEGSLPPSGDEGALRIIPDQVWAIILLADGLNRCPWELSSLPQGWEMRSYIALAIIYVRTAYVYAIDCIGELSCIVSAWQGAFLDALKNRESMDFLGLTDEDVALIAREMMKDGLERSLAKKADPLSKAALSFLESEAYKALAFLVGER